MQSNVTIQTIIILPLSVVVYLQKRSAIKKENFIHIPIASPFPLKSYDLLLTENGPWCPSGLLIYYFGSKVIHISLLQAQLLSVSRHQPGVPPGGQLHQHEALPGVQCSFSQPTLSSTKPKYQRAPVITKTIMPEDDAALYGQSEKTGQDRGRFALDTPAPRRSAPIPTCYETKPNKESQLESHTPLKHNKQHKSMSLA